MRISDWSSDVCSSDLYWSDETGLDMASLKREIRDRITPIPGAEEFLRRVQRSGRHSWIVTNAHRDRWQLKLEHTGFRHSFERVISTTIRRGSCRARVCPSV